MARAELAQFVVLCCAVFFACLWGKAAYPFAWFVSLSWVSALCD